MSASIEASGVGVRFEFDRQRRVVTPLLSLIRRQSAVTWGLRGLDLCIGPGESVALLGRSGSGKTSLLRLIAGVFSVDEGRLDIRGRIAPLLSIEAGLLGSLTGRENASLLGVLGGMSLSETRAGLEAIKGRSGLEDAFERPVLSYSQGMRAKLGYAAVTGVEPDIMLLDEVHEAFDHGFREVVDGQKRVVVAQGGIVMAAGHDHVLLRQLCSRALLLAGGRLIADGPFDEVCDRYLAGGVDEPA